MRKFPLSMILLSLVFMGAGCLGGESVVLQKVELDYWITGDSEEGMDLLIESYQKIHPNVEISLKKVRAEDYERTLLEAFAEDRGPDMFSIPNTWVRGWTEKLLPLPEETEVPSRVVNKEQKIVTSVVKTSTPTTTDIIREYVETVPSDVIITPPPKDRHDKPETHIYGLPLSVDTLAMFYNVDLLKKANITEPPKTWRSVQTQTEKLTVIDEETGEIKQSGVALGLADNIDHHTDLMVSVMMQNGTDMYSKGGRAEFDKYTISTQDKLYPPGVEALIFYQGFNVENSKHYSWSADMPQAIDAFITGKTAFFFGFPDDVKTVRERAPKLNFEIAPLPFITSSRKVTTAHYPIEVVSKKTKSPNEAWDFLLYITQPEQAAEFLNITKRPTALRSLVTKQLTDPDITHFASQVLTAKSWYLGTDYLKVDDIMATMIETRPTADDPKYTPIVTDAARAIDLTR